MANISMMLRKLMHKNQYWDSLGIKHSYINHDSFENRLQSA